MPALCEGCAFRGIPPEPAVAPYQACKRSNTPVPKRNGLARREIGAAVALMGRLDQVPNTIENFRYNPIGGIRIGADFVKVIECFWSV